MFQRSIGERQAGFAARLQRPIEKRQKETLQKNFSQLGDG